MYGWVENQNEWSEKGSVESHSNVKKSKLDWNVKVVGQVEKVGNQRDRYSKYS